MIDLYVYHIMASKSAFFMDFFIGLGHWGFASLAASLAATVPSVFKYQNKSKPFVFSKTFFVFLCVCTI